MFSNPIARTTKKTPKTKKRSFNQSDGENKQENILSDIIGDVLNKVLEKATSKKEELITEMVNTMEHTKKSLENIQSSTTELEKFVSQDDNKILTNSIDEKHEYLRVLSYTFDSLISEINTHRDIKPVHDDDDDDSSGDLSELQNDLRNLESSDVSNELDVYLDLDNTYDAVTNLMVVNSTIIEEIKDNTDISEEYRKDITKALIDETTDLKNDLQQIANLKEEIKQVEEINKIINIKFTLLLNLNQTHLYIGDIIAIISDFANGFPDDLVIIDNTNLTVGGAAAGGQVELNSIDNKIQEFIKNNINHKNESAVFEKIKQIYNKPEAEAEAEAETKELSTNQLHLEYNLFLKKNQLGIQFIKLKINNNPINIDTDIDNVLLINKYTLKNENVIQRKIQITDNSNEAENTYNELNAAYYQKTGGRRKTRRKSTRKTKRKHTKNKKKNTKRYKYRKTRR